MDLWEMFTDGGVPGIVVGCMVIMGMIGGAVAAGLMLYHLYWWACGDLHERHKKLMDSREWDKE